MLTGKASILYRIVTVCYTLKIKRSNKLLTEKKSQINKLPIIKEELLIKKTLINFNNYRRT